MTRRILSLQLAAVALCMTAVPLAFAAPNDDGPYLDVYVSDNSFHAGTDADPRAIGLPVYPGAHIKVDDKQDKNSANLALFTSAFGIKLLVVNYTSDDSAEKIISFYRDKLKKYGKVIECHNNDSDADPHIDAHANTRDDSGKSKELTCDGENKGDNIELKAGTEDNQHAVAIKPNKSGNGASFALVYVHVRGKQADI
ncbi:MAG TPA: hypothetical protein VF753_10030 [Terriglobales bacterium]